MHFEFMGSVADARVITRNLKLFLAPKSSTPKPPPTNQFGNWPTTTKQTIKRGVHGPIVGYLQSVINRKAGGDIIVDNDFGSKTEERVKDVQRFFKVTADGIVGPKTWGIIDYLAKK
jgi:peptidoglycan hydrolase-like protein with peptidoglycan-binding domain